MGNPENNRPRGPCSTCNANGGPWMGEADTVHCLRPFDAGRHVMRGDQATIWSHGCWMPITAELPLSCVLDLLRPAIRRHQ